MSIRLLFLLYIRKDVYIISHLLFLLAHNFSPNCPDSDLSETFNHYLHLSRGKYVPKIDFKRFIKKWLEG